MTAGLCFPMMFSIYCHLGQIYSQIFPHLLVRMNIHVKAVYVDAEQVAKYKKSSSVFSLKVFQVIDSSLGKYSV